MKKLMTIVMAIAIAVTSFNVAPVQRASASGDIPQVDVCRSIPDNAARFFFYIFDAKENNNLSGNDKTTIMTEGFKLQLRATGGYTIINEWNNASCTDVKSFKDIVTWTSSDESVATINNDGVVTATGEGEAVISATIKDQTETTKVKVLANKQSRKKRLCFNKRVMKTENWYYDKNGVLTCKAQYKNTSKKAVKLKVRLRANIYDKCKLIYNKYYSGKRYTTWKLKPHATKTVTLKLKSAKLKHLRLTDYYGDAEGASCNIFEW